ncbi:hypothetical protein ATANTOWER_002765 [Ataeniobius toweri]|uniref:Uncharacterized protein n=1 Tax=Ataeniobius toweri TaxID=208326 RepID=A0ABU7CF44_9TELE|nr:hypothetical protein [Ataeniobius toweri]
MYHFILCFLIHMPFKHTVFPTPLLHSGRSYTPMHPNIPLRLRSKILQGQLINLVSFILPSPEVDHCIASPDGFNSVFKLSNPHLSKNPLLASLQLPLRISETSSDLLTEHRISSIPIHPS